MSSDPTVSIQYLKGVGPKRAELLQKIEIETIKDLLYYFPRDYEDRSKVLEMRHISPGQTVTIRGKVMKIEDYQTSRGFKILKVTFSDDTDVINGVWFNQSYLKSKFEKGEAYLLNGKVSEKNWRKYKSKDINNPVFEKLDDEEDSLNAGRVVPIYSLTEGVNQKRMRKVMANALANYAKKLPDLLPAFIKEKYSFPDLGTALEGIHFPENKEDYIAARRRLAFEEFFIFQLYALHKKASYAKNKGIKHQYPASKISAFLKELNFELTAAQKRVWQEIKADMEKEEQMRRLLQGDVGSGKTIIAALALIETMASGHQGIFMAPTEILAEQHYLNLKELFAAHGYKLALIVGSLKTKEREELESKIAAGEIDLIIGTHALFQSSISYSNPGLIVIDEQHRFGVEQRYQLKSKGENPDLLVMTATPIPRSMAMLIYGDLDLSVIDEMPPGRKPIGTFWRRSNRRNKIYKFVKDKIKEGRQAYLVCPLIEPSAEMPDLISTEELAEELANGQLREFKLSLLHSKLSADQKKEIMQNFRDNKLDILVSTTVIEVGVDVANATVMVIENAERFGLAQLHQLRGRVGRGQHQSYCILISDPPGEDATQRLEVMTSTSDGFKIAEEDLKIRGPGEFFGTRQHGMTDLKIADLIKDRQLLKLVRQESQNMIKTKNWENKYSKLFKKIQQMELKI